MSTTTVNGGASVPFEIPPPPGDLVHKYEVAAWAYLVAGMVNGFHAPRLKHELVRRKDVASYSSLSNVALTAEHTSPALGSRIRYGNRLRPDARALLDAIYAEFYG